MPHLERGIVVSSTRRFVTLYDSDFKRLLGQVARGTIDVVAGDNVEFFRSNDEIIIENALPRKNCLKRASGKKSKELVANVDILLILTAPEPLFNTIFLDRVLAAAHQQQIPQLLVINKIDLATELALTNDKIEIYRKLGLEVLEISAINNIGLDKIKSVLSDSNVKIACLLGVSGVGKSTLLGQLVPLSESKTGEVSEKTGQGKQTTSQANAYVYEPAINRPIIVDLPGLQNFGISFLDAPQIRDGMGDINSLGKSCRFPDCSHRREPDCAVMSALNDGSLAKSRYASYLSMLEEIEESRLY